MVRECVLLPPFWLLVFLPGAACRCRSKNPHRLDIFETKTSFSDIARLYEFDRKLRTLIHDGMEHIEVGLRVRISDRLALTDALSYLDSALFRPEFDHSTWLDTALARVERAKKRDCAIKHYASKYG